MAEPFRFGACGHPYNTAVYNANSSTIPGVPYATQVDMLAQMGMQVYRNNIRTDASGMGNSSVHAKLTNMYNQLDAAAMELFPMFYDNYSAGVSEQENYDRGFAKGVGLATNYGHMFTHCNLGNEWELSRDLKIEDPELPGNEPSHYYQDRVDRALQWIKGADDGMKSIKPDVQTSVAIAGWFPTWWQQQLVENVSLDFVDWHWYAEMQPNIGNLPIDEDSILDHLWNEFGLPIWVTESNERADSDFSQDLNEQRQVNWFDFWYDECVNHPHCYALFIYELLDEPIKGSFREANYGLVTFPDFDPDDQDYTNWQWKRLGRQLTGADQKIGHFGSDSEGWELGLGPEFPGAQGTFARDNLDAMNGTWSGVLTGDFSGGGNYVQISRPINLDLSDLWLWAKSGDLTRVTLRMVDSTGQTHQQRLSMMPDGTWQALHVSAFDSGSGYLHFDGANDGVWHAPATSIELLLPRTGLVTGQISGEVRFDEVIATVP